MTNNLLSKLLCDLDFLKTERHPLPAHYVSNCDEHSRDMYATMLSTVLLSGETISESQTRLFKMLLTAMNLDDRQAKLYEQAQKIDQTTLREFFRVIDENNLALSFIMDAAILSRLDSSLNEGQVRLFSELADSFKLSENEIADVMALAAIILGLPTDRFLPLDYNYYSQFSVWDEFMYRPFTIEKLNAGLTPGLWLLNEHIELNEPWLLDSVILKFTDCASITSGDAGSVNIKNSILHLPKIIFSGNTNITISDSRINGVYHEMERKTAIIFNDILTVRLEDVCFNSVNARSILLLCNELESDVEIKGCKFTECGNPLLNGGALAVLDSQRKLKISISKSTFNKCRAKIGGAIRTSSLKPNEIVECEFIDCEALAYERHKKTNIDLFLFAGGSIFADKLIANFNGKIGNNIYNSSFSNGSVRVGDGFEGSGVYFVKNCTFNQSLIIYHHLYDSNYINYGCSGGYKKDNESLCEKIDMSVNEEKWWSDYS